MPDEPRRIHSAAIDHPPCSLCGATLIRLGTYEYATDIGFTILEFVYACRRCDRIDNPAAA